MTNGVPLAADADPFTPARRTLLTRSYTGRSRDRISDSNRRIAVSRCARTGASTPALGRAGSMGSGRPVAS